MRKLKSILSIVLVLALLCSAFCFTTVNAAEVKTEEVATDVNIQSNINDGVILHAFCWGYSEIEKNLEAIAAAGYSAIQTSPVQDPKDYSLSLDVAGQWWKLYQPVSFSISNNSWLGTKEELKSLCTAADKYGIKIIVDIVSNHLGAVTEGNSSNPYGLAEEVKTFEPTIYNTTGATRNNPYFNQYFNNASDGSVQSVVQGLVSACPDLNTGNSVVQNRVKDLLRSCIDCGVDGFRFDAAKHIETSSDGSYASNYWETVIGDASTYYAQKNSGKSLFCYGEILNTVGSGRSINAYTQLMSVTDNVASKNILGGVTGHNASSAANSSYPLSNNASKAVLWAESHDTYEGSSDSTQGVSNEDIVKAWAMVGSRKDATALYFARPGTMSMGGSATDTTYKSVAVAEVNKFHNNFVGQSEKVGYSGNFSYVARGNNGIVIVNTNGTTANASVSGTGLQDGSYTDMVTGNKFTVSGGTVSGQIGSTGVAVVTQGTTTPKAFASEETQTFQGESITVKLSLSNATSGTYQLENYAPVTFTGSPTIRIGKDYSYGSTINLKLTATDGTQTTSITYRYKKTEAASSGVYVMLPDSFVSQYNWKAPIKCYVYDENTSPTYTYKNANWPGEVMQHDDNLNCYYIQINDNSCLQQTTGSSTTVESTFNLAKSSNTYVIVNDSASSNGAASAGNQFPTDGAKAKLALGGTSHKLTSKSQSAWVTTTDVPGQSAPVSATEVTTGGATQSTSETQPAVTTPTVTTPTVTTPTVSGLTYGDANLDKKIDISDVTAIQKHLADISYLSTDGMAVSDVDGNGSVTIKDATYVQKYIVGMSDTVKVGQSYTPVVPTTPTTEPPTEPTVQPTTQPTTQPQNTYKVYLKTTLPWMTAMGCSVYLYDNNSGISYLMEQDLDAYPNVFIADVPESLTSATIYRALLPVDNPTASAEAYNLMPVTFSKTNNCYTLTAYPDGGSPQGSTGPYVAETPPDFQLTTLYFDNSAANWSEVYVYGWGYGMSNEETLAMTQIPGTNIWKLDLPQAIPDGIETFLFRNAPFSKGWNGVAKTGNITVTKPYNCYKPNDAGGATGSWTTYNG